MRAHVHFPPVPGTEITETRNAWRPLVIILLSGLITTNHTSPLLDWWLLGYRSSPTRSRCDFKPAASSHTNPHRWTLKIPASWRLSLTRTSPTATATPQPPQTAKTTIYPSAALEDASPRQWGCWPTSGSSLAPTAPAHSWPQPWTHMSTAR